MTPGSVPPTPSLPLARSILPTRTLVAVSAVLAAMIMTAPACDRPEVSFVARDSAGVRVLENRGPEWGPGEGWRLGEPSLDLGGADAAGPAAFQYVTRAFFADAGTLVVVESGGDIHLFDPAGEAVGFAGGPGDGPGEFRMVAGAGALGDTLWVYDYSHRRLTYLGLDGALRGTYPLEEQELPMMPVGRLGDGLLLAGTYQPGAAREGRRLGLRRDTVPYLVFGPRGERGRALDTLAAREYVVGEEDGRLTMATPPFARGAQDATGPGVWVHGDQTTRSLRVYTPEGALRSIIRWTGPDLAVTDEAVRREIERRIQRYNEDEAGLRRFFTELEHPERRPAHGRVHVGPEGRIWVETAPGPADTGPFETPGWHIFTAEGRWLGTVEGPGRFRITQILPDRVVGVWQDGLDVEHVQVRPLIRPEPGAGAGSG